MPCYQSIFASDDVSIVLIAVTVVVGVIGVVAVITAIAKDRRAAMTAIAARSTIDRPLAHC